MHYGDVPKTARNSTDREMALHDRKSELTEKQQGHISYSYPLIKQFYLKVDWLPPFSVYCIKSITVAIAQR
ncbi:hypothetical protein GCM10028791_12660 [Echinicola sediminis]